MSVRLRRQQADQEQMRRLARLHPRISVEGVFGNPPERYRLLLRVASVRERGGSVEEASEHRLEITLPLDYPRSPPLCRMLTPVFHPNIAPHAVCVGDHWTAGESLAQLVMRVAEMLAYQSYNVKSPLNGQAAEWATTNRAALPTDRHEMFLDLHVPAETDGCANCGATDRVVPDACRVGHVVCADCLHTCPGCGEVLCLACGGACARCAKGGTP